MNSRTLIALGLLVAGGLFALFALRHKDRHEASATVQSKDQPPFAKLKADDLDSLEITATPDAPGAAKSPVKLTMSRAKGASSWTVTAPFADKANVDTMQQALEGLTSAAWVEPVADSKEAVDKLGCDDAKGAHVVASGGGKVLADVYVCGAAGRARSAARSQIWEVKELDRWRFVKGELKAWRDLTMLEIPKEDMAEIAVEMGAEKARFKREPVKVDGGTATETWSLLEGPAGVDRLDQPTAATLASHLVRMSGNDVATVTPTEAGLDAPTGTVSVTTNGGVTTKLVFGKSLPSGDVYVQRAGDPRIFELLKAAANETLVAPRQLEDRAIAGLESGDVTGMTVDAAGEKATLSKDGATWKATAPAGLKVDTGKVQGLAGQLAVMRAASIADGTPKDAGLDKPVATVTLTTKAGKSVTLKVGVAKESSRYVSRVGAPWIYLVDVNQVSALLKKPSDSLK